MSNSIKIGKGKKTKFKKAGAPDLAYRGLTQSFESRESLQAAMRVSKTGLGRMAMSTTTNDRSQEAADQIGAAMTRVRDRHTPHSGPNKEDKGHKGGSCNRTACQQPGAYWFNHSTRAYYCTPCARMLNREAELFRGSDTYLQDLGHELCTLDPEFENMDDRRAR